MDQAAPGTAKSGRKRPAVRVTGWVLMALGLLLVLYGMAPLLDAFGIIGEPPGEGTGSAADAMVAELKSRVWVDVAGFVLLIVGAVVEAAGRKPLQQTIDDRVQHALEEREGSSTTRREGPP